MNRGSLLAIVGALLMLFLVLTVMRLHSVAYLIKGFEIIAAVLGILSINMIGIGIRAHSYYRLPTFDQYKMQNPKLVQSDGRVKCNACADTRRRAWRWSAHSSFGPTKHLCGQCGKGLYRS